MYHHVNSDRCSNELGMFEKHLAYIAQNFKSVLPGEELSKNSICLTFDDAYADFYFLIYPLLKKYKLKALLAVPSKYILESCDEAPSFRMNFEHNDLFDNYTEGTFCTYTELREMIKSGLISIASHSHSHTNLLTDSVNLKEEIQLSKEILEQKLAVNVESFVFPFGKYNQEILKKTKKHYKYAFRIGNAIHSNFNGINGVIYRVDGDNLTTPDAIFKWQQILKYKFKAFTKKVSNG